MVSTANPRGPSASPSPNDLVGLEVRGAFSARPAQGSVRGPETPVSYKLGRFVGAGKFAWVYDAKSPSGERVAVKLLTRDDVQAVRRFQREIKVMRELPPHPNCVSYKGHGVHNGRAWVAMDFIDGFTLHAIARGGTRLPERAACSLMAQLCAGFEGLHRLGLAHRDITPDNIMITSADRQVKLMDFGLVQDSQGLLQLYEQADVLDGKDFVDDLDAGLIAGTPEFMAPEQILDPSEQDRTRQKTDTTADVFALGTIFYQIVSGQQLFPYERGARGATGKQGLVNYLDYRVRFRDDDLKCPDDVGPELWSVIRKSLAREPKLRQRDATELGADIRYYMETGQGVLEDDMSATISHEFDAARMRSLAQPLTTADFQTIQRAAAAAPHPSLDMPLHRPLNPKPSGKGSDSSTIVDGSQTDSTKVSSMAPSAERIAAARAELDRREPKSKTWLWVSLAALIFAGAILVAFFLTKK